MKRKGFILFMIFVMIFTFSSCGRKIENDSSQRLKVVVSFNPIREIAKSIGKDKVDIKVIIPEATEPHDFEPTAKDLMVLNNSKVFIYNGLNMENWVDKVIDNIDNKEVISVNASSGCKVIDNDPHIWLGLTTAKVEAKNIMDSFIKADPENEHFYRDNFDRFSKQLDNLLKNYKDKFNLVKNKKFVTGHAAFAYLCRDFNLSQNSVEGVFGEGEPSVKRIKELIEYCKKNNVKTIFMESQVSPKVSETLAKEINGNIEKINTLECREDNKDYISIMKDNLDKIYNSLK